MNHKSKIYKFVYHTENGHGNSENGWYGRKQIDKKHFETKIYPSEKEAATELDKTLINGGQQPINIFKKK